MLVAGPSAAGMAHVKIPPGVRLCLVQCFFKRIRDIFPGCYATVAEVTVKGELKPAAGFMGLIPLSEYGCHGIDFLSSPMREMNASTSSSS